MNNFLDYDNEISKLLDAANVSISSIKPSEWCEANRMMTSDVSPIPGMFRYGNSPYTREIVDCLSNDHPSRTIAIMKGAQIGFSTGVIEAGIGWIVSQNPGNILFLVGHEDLISDAMNKVDRMIDSSGIRHFIRSNSNRAKNNKSGDTDQRKDYPGGYLKLGIANHKYLRNISMQYGFIDDFESMRSSTKESGSTQEMIEQRFAAYAKKMKLFYISTPELKATSNIHPVYLKGDQRKWHVPCPCCGEFIVLEWQIKIENTNDKFGGITYELNEDNELIPESVGYTCQKCMGFFDESVKTEIIKLGKYIPTAKAVDPTFISFHISALYGSSFMYGWTKYVRQYLEACPPNKARNEKKWQTFQNLVLGEPYEPTGISIKANQLQQNCR
jgi:phage terminase large subunit GpA-like protein